MPHDADKHLDLCHRNLIFGFERIVFINHIPQQVRITEQQFPIML